MAIDPRRPLSCCTSLFEKMHGNVQDNRDKTINGIVIEEDASNSGFFSRIDDNPQRTNQVGSSSIFLFDSMNGQFSYRKKIFS